MRTAIDTALALIANAMSPMRPAGEKLEPAIPPSPVAGAPTGMIVPEEVPDPGEPLGCATTGLVVVVVGFLCSVVVVVGAVVVVVVTASEQTGTVTVLSSSVTAPV
jgi:hypothetical protein